MTNTLAPEQFPIGTRVQITADREPRLRTSDRFGKKGTVVGHSFGANQVHFDGEEHPALGTWTPKSLDVITEEAAPERPTVKFSGESRRTAREYAEIANSRVLTEDSQKILKAAARGRDVDAYALNEAVLDAMRSATTRCGQSMSRRALATKIAYLGHIVQAVLESHADGLPTFDNGAARSRKVTELSEALAAARSLNEGLEREIADNHRQAVEEGATLAQRVSDAEERERNLLDAAEKRDALLAETVQDRGVLADVLQYAIGRLSASEQQRVLGYWDGVKA